MTLSWTGCALLAAVAVVVSSPPLRAQTYSANVLEQTGQVDLVQGGYRTPLFPGSAVKPQEMIVTGPDGYARFQVSDGSTFEVFHNSRVIFREHLGNWKDLLNVWLGRVKVFIQHTPGGNPNDVSSPTAVISVRGTVFDVVVEDDDGTTLVTVDEGTVWVRNLTAPGSPAVLNQGDYVRVFRGQPLAPRQVDKGGIIRNALKVARDAAYEILLRRQAGGTGPVGQPAPTAPSGDKCGTKCGTGPGAPPPPPGG